MSAFTSTHAGALQAAPLRRALLVGLTGWAIATAAFRLAGEWFFLPGTVALAVAFLLIGPVVALGAALLRRVVSRDPADTAAVAIGFVLPGLLLDAAVTLAFARVFPNLDPSLDAAFGALMLWGYALIAAAVMADGWRAGRGM